MLLRHSNIPEGEDRRGFNDFQIDPQSEFRNYPLSFFDRLELARFEAGAALDTHVLNDLVRLLFLADNGACTRVCPAGAIIGEKKKPHKIIQDMCIKCGACFETCKFKAIKKG